MPSKTSELNFTAFFNELRKTAITGAAELEKRTQQKLEEANHGDFLNWLHVLADLPELEPSQIDLNRSTIQIGSSHDLAAVGTETLKANAADEFSPQSPSPFGRGQGEGEILPSLPHPNLLPLMKEKGTFRDSHTALKTSLKKLHPWRKGPFDLFGIFIDTEWRSDLKWKRIEQAIQPLTGRVILDLGCGNGYYLWRMIGSGARLALGIDPALLFNAQFQVFQKYANVARLAVLPLGVEDLPEKITGFDTVFSMGLLYHRRDPLEHLKQIWNLLRPGGELVLETLVVDGAAGEILKPGERYAKMRNVWNIPTCATAEFWLSTSGFKSIRCVDITSTTAAEQRKTEWMQFESLENFLDPKDLSKTVEGYPAPKRAIFIASK